MWLESMLHPLSLINFGNTINTRFSKISTQNSDLIISISLFLLLVVRSMAAGILMLVGSSCQKSRGTEGRRGNPPRKGWGHEWRHHTALEVLLVHLHTDMIT